MQNIHSLCQTVFENDIGEVKIVLHEETVCYNRKKYEHWLSTLSEIETSSYYPQSLMRKFWPQRSNYI